jgi:hypothetical protein
VIWSRSSPAAQISEDLRKQIAAGTFSRSGCEEVEIDEVLGRMSAHLYGASVNAVRALSSSP